MLDFELPPTKSLARPLRHSIFFRQRHSPKVRERSGTHVFLAPEWRSFDCAGLAPRHTTPHHTTPHHTTPHHTTPHLSTLHYTTARHNTSTPTPRRDFNTILRAHSRHFGRHEWVGCSTAFAFGAVCDRQRHVANIPPPSVQAFPCKSLAQRIPSATTPFQRWCVGVCSVLSLTSCLFLRTETLHTSRLSQRGRARASVSFLCVFITSPRLQVPRRRTTTHDTLQGSQTGLRL